MGKLKNREKLETARQWMQKHDVDPVDRLCREAVLELKLTEEQAKHPSVVSLLGNYEMLPSADGSGYTLRLAVHRRIEVFKTLAEFCYPKLRSTEVKLEEDRNITWTIRTFSTDEKKSYRNSNGQIVEWDESGKPKILPLAESERLELHDGDKFNQG